MAKKRIPDQALIELAEIYNTQGRSSMYAYLREKYNYNNTAAIFIRMTKYKFLNYDKSTDKFEIKGKTQTSADDVFMSIDELCASKQAVKNIAETTVDSLQEKENAMRKLIQDLLGDWLLEMNRYIVLEPSARTMFIDKTLLERDGYKVVMH